MILGMTPFTFFHVVLSLVGILSGLVVVGGLIRNKRLTLWTAIFLASTVATSVTGFMFPFEKFLPSHAVGIVSLLALLVAILARYIFFLIGGWRRTYVISAVLSLYLNVFVLIAQLFGKFEALRELAPTQTEPPFLIAQGICLAIFVVVGIVAAKTFK